MEGKATSIALEDPQYKKKQKKKNTLTCPTSVFSEIVQDTVWLRHSFQNHIQPSPLQHRACLTNAILCSQIGIGRTKHVLKLEWVCLTDTGC